MDDLPGTCEECGGQGPSPGELQEIHDRTGDPVVALHDCRHKRWMVYTLNQAAIDKLLAE